jgi:cysteinyl-tRNA synthetase
MDDDLNTAGALAALFEFVREANTLLSSDPCSADAAVALDALREMGGVLGLLTRQETGIPDEVRALADARAAARAAKNWAESDRLRNELARMGYLVEDTREGQTVRKA